MAEALVQGGRDVRRPEPPDGDDEREAEPLAIRGRWPSRIRSRVCSSSAVESGAPLLVLRCRGHRCLGRQLGVGPQQGQHVVAVEPGDRSAKGGDERRPVTERPPAPGRRGQAPAWPRTTWPNAGHELVALEAGSRHRSFTSASPVGRVGPGRDQQGDVEVAYGRGDAEADRHDVEKGDRCRLDLRLGTDGMLGRKVVAHLESQLVVPRGQIGTLQQRLVGASVAVGRALEEGRALGAVKRDSTMTIPSAGRPAARSSTWVVSRRRQRRSPAGSGQDRPADAVDDCGAVLTAKLGVPRRGRGQGHSRGRGGLGRRPAG